MRLSGGAQVLDFRSRAWGIGNNRHSNSATLLERGLDSRKRMRKVILRDKAVLALVLWDEEITCTCN